MRKTCFLLLLTALGMTAGAQRVYYIYMQSEGAAPFYVKWGDQVVSASPVGHVVLSGLVDSTYVLRIGMPSLESPEAKFTIRMGGSDKGYTIRPSGGSLQLFDLQHLTLIKPETAKETGIRYEKRTDAFSSLLAKASGDPGLLLVAVAAVGAPVNTPEAAVVLKTETETPKETVSAATSENAGEKKIDAAIAPAAQLEKEINTGSTDETVQMKAETPAEKEVTAAVEKDSGKDAAKEAAAGGENEQKEEAPFLRSRVSKYSESSTSEGFGLVYFDQGPGGTDTVRLLIPNPKIFLNTSEVKKDESRFLEFTDSAAVKPVQEGAAKELPVTKAPEVPQKGTDSLAKDRTTDGEGAGEKKEGKAAESKDLKTDEGVAVPREIPVQQSEVKDAGVSVPGAETKKEAGALVPPPVSCRAHASENDFFRLRKTMVTRDTDEAMVAEAKKIFRNKCFTTEQVQNLGALFLTSAGKYLFYEAAFMHVSDRESFPRLGSDLKDEYYSRRFKALIGE